MLSLGLIPFGCKAICVDDVLARDALGWKGDMKSRASTLFERHFQSEKLQSETQITLSVAGCPRLSPGASRASRRTCGVQRKGDTVADLRTLAEPTLPRDS